MSVASLATTDVKPSLKRSISELDSDPRTPISSLPAAKRPKVQFSSSNKIFTLKNWDDDKTLALVREEVKRALEKHRVGENSLYDGIREVLTIKPTALEAPSATLLKRYLVAFTGMSGQIGSKCDGLVAAIMSMQWVGRDEEFLALFQSCLANIIASYGGHANDIFEALLDCFMTLRPAHGKLPGHSVVSLSQMLDRVHGTIEHILAKVPAAINSLLHTMRTGFPHSSDPLREHLSYVSNILRLSSYVTFIKSDIVALIFNKLTTIDTNTQKDILDLEDELQDYLEQDLSQEIATMINPAEVVVDDLDDPFDSDEEEDDDEEEDPNKKRLTQLKQEVAKLDGIMELMFGHFDPVFAKQMSLEQESALDQMFSMFSRMILPTNKTRHVQFLLFHYAQTSEQLRERFVQSLIASMLEQNTDRMVKRSASAYLASFIARGAHISRDLVQYTFYTLAKELNRLRSTHEKNENIGPDVNRFGTYYTIFQCLMYIFCFRWRDLLLNDYDESQFDVSDLQWARDVKSTFSVNIYSKLNPLKVCAQPIVQQFAIVVRQLQILLLEPKLEQNRRIRLTRSMFASTGGFSILAEKENSLSGKVGEAQFQLEAYFPFDPYNLPLSKRWIEGDYNEWKTVPGFADDEEDDSSDSDHDSEDDDDEEPDFDEPTETDSVASR